MYEIGVSQCSEDDWRFLLKSNIQREARCQGGMDVDVKSADRNSQKQIKDIETFIEQGKDLIIVVPNVASDIRPVVEKAYDKGIPVILIDRKIEGDKYTAFIGANNNEIGKHVAEYIVANAKGEETTVIELVGLEGSSPAMGRHEGFVAGTREHNNIRLIATANADWNEEESERIMTSLLMDNQRVDYVFAHNDRMAMGARKAVERAHREKEVKIIGVDGLVVDGGGVDKVINKQFVATYLYPTGGSEAILLAKEILEGNKFKKEISLPVAIIDSTNARIMKLQYQSVKAQDEICQKIERQSNLQIEKINEQELIMWSAALWIIVLGVAVLMIVLFYREKKSNDGLLIGQLRSLIEQHQLTLANPDANVSVTTPISERIKVFGNTADQNEEEIVKQEEEVIRQDNAFLAQIEDVLGERLYDSKLSICCIAHELGISCNQLCCKVKAMSERNVNEIARRARLEKAKVMMSNTDLTISEIAYSVGFTSLSYFTKCYKDYFGESPSEK